MKKLKLKLKGKRKLSEREKIISKSENLNERGACKLFDKTCKKHGLEIVEKEAFIQHVYTQRDLRIDRILKIKKWRIGVEIKSAKEIRYLKQNFAQCVDYRNCLYKREQLTAVFLYIPSFCRKTYETNVPRDLSVFLYHLGVGHCIIEGKNFIHFVAGDRCFLYSDLMNKKSYHFGKSNFKVCSRLSRYGHRNHS